MPRSSVGSVRKLKSGRYQASVEHPESTSNKRRRINAPYTFATRREANMWIAEISGEIERGEWKTPEQLEAERLEAERQALIDGYTLGEYWEEVYAPRKSGTLASTTWHAYESHYRNHISKRWVNVALKDITRRDVQQWRDSELVAKRKGKSLPLKSVYDTFRAIINEAISDEYLDVSPLPPKGMPKARKAQGFKSRRHEPRALSPDVILMIANDLPPSQQGIFLLQVLLALRPGEARELRRGDIDLEGRTVTIRHSCSGDGKRKAVGAPKTEDGVRTLSLTDEALAVIEDALSKTLLKGKDDLVFPSSQNPRKHIGESTMQINLRRAMKRLGLETASPYDLRHTGATLAASVPGVSVRDIQHLLGHSTPNMSLNYMHATQQAQQRLAEGVSDAIFGPSNVIELPTGTEE